MLKKSFARQFLFRQRPWLWKLVLILVLLSSLGVRLYDLTDLPLDFASTRQLFSALKARGMYYQHLGGIPEEKRTLAVNLGKVGDLEPPVIETIVSLTYHLTGEHLWIARVYSSLFWVLGGLALFLLIKEMTSAWPALIGTLFYLFVPFGVIASRSFQPDPLMVALIVYSLWALFRWQNTHAWKWAVILGLLGGLAIYVKLVSVFFVAGAFAGVALGILGWRRAWRDPQVWTIGVLFLLPSLIDTLVGVLSSSISVGGYLSLRFFPNLLIDPAFYFRWDWVIGQVTGFGASLLAALGIFLADPRRERPMLAGLWIGYLLFGLTFNYAFYTHYYYQLPFIVLVALSFSPALQALFDRFFERSPGVFARLVVIGLIVGSTAVQAWYVRDQLLEDYRPETAFWSELGDILGEESSVIGLTHDYGYRLAYWGWKPSASWFSSADFNVRYMAGMDLDLLQMFQEDTAGKQYFLVTMLDDFNSQVEIHDLLFTHYPVYVQGEGYIIFDLDHPLSADTP